METKIISKTIMSGALILSEDELEDLKNEIIGMMSESDLEMQYPNVYKMFILLRKLKV